MTARYPLKRIFSDSSRKGITHANQYATANTGPAEPLSAFSSLLRQESSAEFPPHRDQITVALNLAIVARPLITACHKHGSIDTTDYKLTPNQKA
jgi:hypothetical protein